MCPWGDSQESPPPVETTSGIFTAGVCQGVLGVSKYVNSEHVTSTTMGSTGYGVSMLSSGTTQYASETTLRTSALGAQSDTSTLVDFTGKLAYSESVFNEGISGKDLANTTPACIMMYDSMNGIMSQGLVGSQSTLTNYPDSMMVTEHQVLVGPSNVGSNAQFAVGSMSTHSSMSVLIGDSAILQPTLGTGVHISEDTYWNGNFQFNHQFTNRITNMGSLARNLTSGS